VTIPGRGGVEKSLKLVNERKIIAGAGCRPPLLKTFEKDIVATQIAWGAITFIVNNKNSVSNISSQEAKDILMGRLTNWKSLGGKDKKIILYVRKDKKSGVGYSTRKLFFHDENIEYTPTAKLKGSSGPIRKAISRQLYSFGIDDIVSANKNKKIKILKMDEVYPSKRNISNGRYVYSRPLYIYTKGEPKGENKRFIDFALSPEGQTIISNNGTVNLAEGINLNK
jgi:phosphate transport system substrate-binding protein